MSTQRSNQLSYPPGNADYTILGACTIRWETQSTKHFLEAVSTKKGRMTDSLRLIMFLETWAYPSRYLIMGLGQVLFTAAVFALFLAPGLSKVKESPAKRVGYYFVTLLPTGFGVGVIFMHLFAHMENTILIGILCSLTILFPLGTALFIGFIQVMRKNILGSRTTDKPNKET